MASSLDTEQVRQFHTASIYVMAPAANGGQEIRMGQGGADSAMGAQELSIEPSPFKIYPTLDPILLPRNPIANRVAALDALESNGRPGTSTAPLDLNTLAQSCLRSIGILKSWQRPGGKTLHYRAAGCTGARYHLDLYLITGQLDGLAPGVYHYGAHDHALRLLRKGDVRGNVAAATGNTPEVARAEAIVVCASTFWRNAWRYQERTYRRAFWDTGTLFANFLSVAAAAGQPATVVMGFADDEINSLIGVDGEREAAIALIALGNTGGVREPRADVAPLTHEVTPPSASEIDFPLIRATHRATSLWSDNEAAKWRKQRISRNLGAPTGALIPLRPLTDGERPTGTIESVIERRRSNRHYAGSTPLPFALFSTVLKNGTAPAATDALERSSPPLHDLYLIVNNVEGVPAGSYRYRRDLDSIELLAAGDHREAARQLACGQDYAAEAHVNVYALADLEPVLETYGARGYRLAQFEAALVGGRLQLAAHAVGLGAVGSTSADNDVIAHFSPDAAGKSYLFVAVFGVKRRATDAERLASTGFIKESE